MNATPDQAAGPATRRPPSERTIQLGTSGPSAASHTEDAVSPHTPHGQPHPGQTLRDREYSTANLKDAQDSADRGFGKEKGVRPGGHTGPDAPSPGERSPLTGASLARAREALGQASGVRAEHLLAITEGTLTVLDVIEAACTGPGRPLRRIGLRQLCLAQQGWGIRRTDALLSTLAERAGDEGALRDLDIAWLIDPRYYGRRFLLWADLLRPRRTAPPWPGFPYAPSPTA